MTTPNLLARDLDEMLANTSGIFEELRGRRIFITGATGFLDAGSSKVLHGRTSTSVCKPRLRF